MVSLAIRISHFRTEQFSLNTTEAGSRSTMESSVGCNKNPSTTFTCVFINNVNV